MKLKEKLQMLGRVIASIEKQFGKGAIMCLKQQEAATSFPTISSGSLALDRALGIGGYPRGRIVEIFGPEATGKSTLALHAIRECQKDGGVAAFIDAEHALDVSYAQRIGISMEELMIAQPDSGEQALEIADLLIRSNSVDLVVIDSVAALIPQAELEGEMGDQHIGRQARLMSQALRKIVGALYRSQTVVVFINQLRYKIGVMFGSPETTTGGNALKFYSSIRLDLRRTGTVKEGERLVGNRVRVKVVKNKVAPPFAEAEFELRFGEGISRETELLDLGIEQGLIDRSGSWYGYKETRLGQGRERARLALQEQPQLQADLVHAIKAAPPKSAAAIKTEESEVTEACAN